MYYLYRTLAGGYEEHYETTYFSEIKYSQEEFENIVIEAYKASCEYYINKEDRNVCFALDFSPEERCWDYEGFFNSYLEKNYKLFSVSKTLTAKVFIDITHYGRSEEINSRIKQALDSIPVDESCWDNECSRLPKEKDSLWYRDNCLVYQRKQARIKERDCENCVGCSKEDYIPLKSPCQYWQWDGDGTLPKY